MLRCHSSKIWRKPASNIAFDKEIEVRVFSSPCSKIAYCTDIDAVAAAANTALASFNVMDCID